MTAHVVMTDAQAAQVAESVRAALGSGRDVVSHHGTFIASGRRAYAVTLQALGTQTFPERGFIKSSHGVLACALLQSHGRGELHWSPRFLFLECGHTGLCAHIVPLCGSRNSHFLPEFQQVFQGVCGVEVSYCSPMHMTDALTHTDALLYISAFRVCLCASVCMCV